MSQGPRIPAPNYTQTPNVIFDYWLPRLKLVEIRVLMVIARKTLGWHKQRDQISLAQLEELTHCLKSRILEAIKKLEFLGLIKKITTGTDGSQTTFYELIIDDSNNFYQGTKKDPPQYYSVPPPQYYSVPPQKKSFKEKDLNKDKESKPKKGADIEVEPLSTSATPQSLVKISKEDKEKLIEKFSKPEVDDTIENLEAYSLNSPDKFKKYKCHAAVIQTWIKRDRQRKSEKTNIEINKATAWREKNECFKDFSDFKVTSTGVIHVSKGKDVSFNMLPEKFNEILIRIFEGDLR